MKHRTLWAVLLFLSGIGILVFLLIWTNPIERREFEFEGKGIRLSPYRINSVEDLEKLRDLVNDGESFSHIYFEQTKDLDLADIENWVPIGVYGKNQYFYGVYDGAGHTICNFTCISDGNVGLFGVLGGEVRNLGIESGYIEGACVGSISSHGIISSSIINCYNKAAVHGAVRAGGIADNMGGGSIQHCWNLGEVSADSGVNYGISSYDAVMNGCYCVNLSPAPKTRCTVSDTITFTLEELKDIEKRNLYEDVKGNIKTITPYNQTVMFEQKDMHRWLKTYWILLFLALCSIICYFMVFVNKRKSGNIEHRETVESSQDSDSSCVGQVIDRKRILCITLFLILYLSGMMLINQTLVLKFDTGIVSMQNYYKQPKETVDVLFLGSSRVGMSLDLETLWKYYGIPSYVCWGGRQPMWNSYYYLKEAVDTSKPKVVALEVGTATLSFEYLDDGHQYGNTYAIRNIINRVQAVQLSAPQKRWNDLILGFPIYHSRFNELTQDDFMHYFWNTDDVNDKGNSVRYGSGNYDLTDVSGVIETKKIQPKEEIYLRKIIELCQNEEMQLVLFAMPHSSRNTEQPYLNTIQEIADEYGISFINFNLLDEETGFEAEDFWVDGHLNTNGGRKIADYLGKSIMSSYMLLDHRGDETYKSWDIFADNMENDYLGQITEADDYFAELARDNRTAVIMKRDVPEESEAYGVFMQNISDTGFDLDFLAEKGESCYVVDLTGKQQYDCIQNCSIQIEDMSIVIDFPYTGEVSVNNDTIYTLPETGIICMVYDSFSKEIVDIAVFSEDTQYAAKHQ